MGKTVEAPTLILPSGASEGGNFGVLDSMLAGQKKQPFSVDLASSSSEESLERSFGLLARCALILHHLSRRGSFRRSIVWTVSLKPFVGSRSLASVTSFSNLIPEIKGLRDGRPGLP